jgi:hypothetical protein
VCGLGVGMVGWVSKLCFKNDCAHMFARQARLLKNHFSAPLRSRETTSNTSIVTGSVSLFHAPLIGNLTNELPRVAVVIIDVLPVMQSLSSAATSPPPICSNDVHTVLQGVVDTVAFCSAVRWRA